MQIRTYLNATLRRLPRLRFRTRPGHMPVWRPEQARLPRITFDSTHVHIQDVRDFAFHSATDFTPAYLDQRFALAGLERAWYIVAPFTKDWRGPAHTFLSFGFDDGRYLSVSIESRRAAGEGFSMIKGMLGQYDLMYVLGTERDLIGLRAVTWNDPVYLYPIRASQEHVHMVFVSMLRRAAALVARPEFYHTLTNNCTTNILLAVNQIAAPPIPMGPKILLPGYSDALAYERGLIDTDLSLEAAREGFQIPPLAQGAMDDPAFSTLIRASAR